VDVWWFEERGAHAKEWMDKSQEFIDRTFSLSNNRDVKCPCNRCRNDVCEDDRMGDDRMDEMFDAIRLELETNHEDPHTLVVQKFFNILRDLEESLHEHTTISVLAFITRLMVITSKFVFSNNCYKEFLNLVSDVHRKECMRRLMMWMMQDMMT
jgi:hypothetical protein